MLALFPFTFTSFCTCSVFKNGLSYLNYKIMAVTPGRIPIFSFSPAPHVQRSTNPSLGWLGVWADRGVRKRASERATLWRRPIAFTKIPQKRSVTNSVQYDTSKQIYNNQLNGWCLEYFVRATIEPSMEIVPYLHQETKHLGATSNNWAWNHLSP